jgi:fatty acid desaturase
MNASVQSPPRALFRDRADALANTAVLLVTTVAWLGSFALMSAPPGLVNVVGVLLCTHAMVLAAYLVHEAAHQTLFAIPRANRRAGEAMSFIAGSSYASFERIRHLHIRHHVDRADLVCFDFKALMRRHSALRQALEALEWAYIPATEILMHLQVVWRPFFVRSQRRHLPRAAAQLVLRGGLLILLGLWSPRALILYALALLLELHVLNFFDAFHHTFDQFVVEPDDQLSMDGRDRTYEHANTYSNLISQRHSWLNLLILNFGYHNAHHHRPSVPWWRLPRLHRDLYGDAPAAVMPIRELLGTWHRNRVRRVSGEEYGGRGQGACRADSFVGAHGVSFLSVV